MRVQLRSPVTITRVLLSVGAILLLGCATTTTPVVVGTSFKPAYQDAAAAGKGLFLLPPLMTVEDASTEKPLSPVAHGSNQAIEFMMTVAVEELTLDGFHVVTYDDLDPDTQAPASSIITRLHEECRVLTSSFRDKSALLPSLQQLAEISGADYVCVQTAKVKIGTGSSYNMNTGEMAQGTSSSTVKIAFVSLANGDVIWENQSMARCKPTNKKFKKAVKMLYAARTGR